MQWFRFSVAVALTSTTLVATLVAGGGLLASRVLANGAPFGPPMGLWQEGHGGRGGFQLPSELEGLRDVPAGERFAHFKGVQINLTDRNNQAVVVAITPGTVTAVSASSLTVAANDGSTKTYSLDDKTTLRGKQALTQNDNVVVATLNGGSHAHAVLTLGADGAGPWGGHHPWTR